MSDATSVQIADSISNLEQVGDLVPVALSNELVRLLSEQLYQSPLKAIEELVVNSYDADASECRVYVPAPSDQIDYIVVYDDGAGMSREGLSDLWQIGRSNKNQDRSAESKKKRKYIGKFGIGKLATFTITQKLTYITKQNGHVLCVSVNFDDFSDSPTGAGDTIYLPVWEVSDWTAFISETGLVDRLKSACVDAEELGSAANWTIALLEGLKDKARRLKSGELRWVLSTAMPLKVDFKVFLNCQEVASSKESTSQTISFEVVELPQTRLSDLAKATGEAWKIEGGKLVSASFPLGVSGSAIVAERTLTGKSDDLARSHGFFVRVRDRLVNEEDALFGLQARVHGTWNRFRADVQADDLDQEIKASREAVKESPLKSKFQTLLLELFNEANSRWEKHKRVNGDKNNPKKEGERILVSPHLVEYPAADALLTHSQASKGSEADEGWFYINAVTDTDMDAVVQSLYNQPRRKYSYEYRKQGQAERLVKFDLPTSTFWINQDHELAEAYWEEGSVRSLLEDIVTAEAMLEIYLRERQVAPHVIGEVLETRDSLLRSLARDHPYSLNAVATALRDAASDKYELEIQLVVAARAMGFVATHIAGAGEPDGIARFTDYPAGEKKIVLEAKSSDDVPSLGSIDFAGLRQHTTDYKADGCLLVAPSYPGVTREEDAAAAKRAREQKISCWTIDQLARFIAQAENRHLNAQHLLDIVLNAFSPIEVSTAVDKLLAEPTWANSNLYQAILKALRGLEGRLKDRPRTADLIAAEISREAQFSEIEGKTIDQALRELAGASQGGMTFREGSVRIHVSYDELERRLQNLAKQSIAPRRKSEFRSE